MAVKLQTDIILALKETMDAEIHKALENAVCEALAQVEKDLRSQLGKIALSLLSQYTVKNMGHEIIIKVSNEVNND